LSFLREILEMKTLAEEIALWVSELSFEELPGDVIRRAKEVLLDSLGCALGALNAVPVRMVREVVRERGGNPQSTPVGVGWKTSCDQATFVDGMAIRYLDFNDYSTSGSHASMNVAPALALAEARGLSGKDCLLGIVVGYDLQLRLREASAKGKTQGWDHSTSAHYSAAAVAGKLLGLPPAKIAHALAIAGCHASTLGEVRRGKLSMWKGGAEAMGVKNGAFAALLAGGGLTGPLTVLEGKHGYGQLVAGALEPELLRERSGDFQILKSCIKAWPCFFLGQAPIAAALKIRGHGVLPEQIKKITVGLGDLAYKNQQRFSKENISTREDADHSIPYCVARALLHGDLRLEHFAEEVLKEPGLLELLRKVTLRRDAKIRALAPETIGARVEVKLGDGRVFQEEVIYPPGHARNPLSEEGLRKKFFMLAENVLGKDRAAEAAEMALHAEELSNLEPLLDTLRAQPAL